jgi:erythromycin esterase-like protein
MPVSRLLHDRRRRRPTALAVVALCAALASCSSGDAPVEPPPPPPPPPPPALPAGVYALAGLSPSLPHDDLAPFRAIVGDARFVALGESTHMSAGYYQAKARLIRYMVEEMGFRAVAFETPWIEGSTASRYVASCTGTPEQAVNSMTVVWRDVSVRDMLRWLCEYNQAHPADPVVFFGFDIQEPGWGAPAMREFLVRVAPGEVTRAAPLERCLGAGYRGLADYYRSTEFQDHAAGRRDVTANQQCMAAIADLEAWIAANADALERATSVAAVEEARLTLLALRAWQEQLWIPDPGGYQARDRGMAETLRRLHALRAPGRKTVVWAWNWHIALRYDEVRGFDGDPSRVVPRQGARAMGSFLRDALGADYLPIGIVGYDVRVPGTGSPPIPTHALSVERRLHELGRDHLLVDLRQPVGGTLLPPGTTYSVSQEWGDPYRQFAALLFVDESPAMTLVGASGQ